MIINKPLRNKLYNQHIGTGIVAFKSGDNELNIFEFFVDKNNKIRFITNDLKSPEVNINQHILENCNFEE